MTQQLYKASVQYAATSVSEMTAHIAGFNNPISPRNQTAIVTEYVRDRNREFAKPVFDQAIEYLEDKGRKHHLISWYDNTDQINGVGRIMFVFSDRTTAMLFKLSMN